MSGFLQPISPLPSAGSNPSACARYSPTTASPFSSFAAARMSSWGKVEQPPATGSAAPFDLMVDDIEAARRDYAAKGLGPSDISRGRIHDSFHVTGPDGYDFTITSSHAG